MSVLLGLAPRSAAAQTRDSTYVEDIGYRYRVNGGLRLRNEVQEYTTLDGQRFELQNKNLAFRIGGRYRLASYTFSIPVSDLGTGSDEEEGTGWGLGLRLYRRFGYFRTQFRITDGFRLTQDDGTSAFRDDVKLFTAYVYAYHLFNTARFSLRASYNQRDRQLKSAGSWLAGGLVTRRRLRSDGLVIGLDSGEDALLSRFAQTAVGLGGGYAYTAIFGRHFYATPLLYAGPELRWSNLQRESTGRRAEGARLGLQFRARLAVGWNSGRHFAALIADYTPNTDNTSLLNTKDVRQQLELRIGTQW